MWDTRYSYPNLWNKAFKVSKREDLSNGKSGSQLLRWLDERFEWKVSDHCTREWECLAIVVVASASNMRPFGMELWGSWWLPLTVWVWPSLLGWLWIVGRHAPCPSGSTGSTYCRWRSPTDPEMGTRTGDISCRTWQRVRFMDVPTDWTLDVTTWDQAPTPPGTSVLGMTDCLHEHCTGLADGLVPVQSICDHKS